MCFGGGAKDNSAQIAGEAEARRQALITAGHQKVNDTFDQFGPEYFHQIRQNYLNYYKPQLAEQFDEARRSNILSLAQSGQIDSSSGARQLANLFRANTRQEAQLGERSLNAEQQARADLERNRSEVLGQVDQGSGIESAATSATARAAQLTAPAPYSALGDVFSQFAVNGSNYVDLRRAGYGDPRFAQQPAAPGGNAAASVRTVK